jgi:hypothetical protein
VLSEGLSTIFPESGDEDANSEVFSESSHEEVLSESLADCSDSEGGVSQLLTPCRITARLQSVFL